MQAYLGARAGSKVSSAKPPAATSARGTAPSAPTCCPNPTLYAAGSNTRQLLPTAVVPLVPPSTAVPLVLPNDAVLPVLAVAA